ncbi:uncharacterized protein [Palaemon carinicauda]|uniref:uncharacterized protein n=1 Tax=Palaemon carinicauda TaxID=392227 RepID=UPI0035B6530D
MTPEGVYCLFEKVAAFQNFLTPSTVKAMQKNFVMINYYHRFLPAITTALSSFYASPKCKPKDLKLGPLQEPVFCNAKKALSTTGAFTFPIPNIPCLLSVDASDIACRSVLEHVINGSPRHWLYSLENC